ncbi:hypothetical protein Taro_016765, partial [Colocasia esculenta]|nr:hypothetical protein [Colocasia esculenta]
NFSVISHNGASGVYPGCTDLAYKQAVDDGADYIDCPVQVTKDGTLVCLNSADLTLSTTAATSSFNSRFSVIPDIQSDRGIFTFNLTWQEIQKSLKPDISNPQLKYQLLRNPLYKNAGNFMTFTDFLAFAKDKAISGVLIGIENAAFLAEHLGFSVIDAVLKALDNAGYNNQTRLEVIIQSRDSSVLMKMRQKTNYKLVYMIDEFIRDASPSSMKDIAGFAHSVAIHKESIYPKSAGFIVAKTEIAAKFKSANISVFGYLFANEFTSQPWDFYSDATMEIKEYVQQAGVDGIITDFPRTAVAYRRNSCLNLGHKTPRYMLLVEPAALLAILPPQAMPPALPPMPTLTVADLVEPPLPPASLNMPSSLGATVSPAPVTPNGEPFYSVSLHVSLLLTMASFLLIQCGAGWVLR